MPRAKLDPSTAIIQKFLALPTDQAGTLLHFLSVTHETRLRDASATTTAAGPTRKPRGPNKPKPQGAQTAAAPSPAPLADKPPRPQGVPKRRPAGHAAGTPPPVIGDGVETLGGDQ